MATATVVVLDVGKGMDGQLNNTTYLEQAVEAVALLVEQKVGRRHVCMLCVCFA
jgi:uncharacterized protein (DUF58 family)